jgi:hypothetical protein
MLSLFDFDEMAESLVSVIGREDDLVSRRGDERVRIGLVVMRILATRSRSLSDRNNVSLPGTALAVDSRDALRR